MAEDHPELVKDIKQAEELAHLYKPAMDREAELLRQKETSLTKEQEDNVAIMNGLQEKYPNAFREIIDDKGRKVLALELWGEPLTELNSRRVYFSQEGALSIALGNKAMYLNEEMNIASLIDSIDSIKKERKTRIRQRQPLIGHDLKTESILNSKGKERWQSLKKTSGTLAQDESGYDRTYVILIDLSNNGNQAALKQAFPMAEAENIKNREIARARETSVAPQKILANL